MESKEKTNTKPTRKRRLGAYWSFVLIVSGIIVLFLLLSLIKSFGDWYVDHIFPLLHGVVARVWNVFPFAFGEIVMYAGAVLVAVTLVWSLVMGVLAIIRAVRRKERKRRRVYRVYMKSILVVALLFLWCYLFHWWLPYSGHVCGRDTKRQEITSEDLRVALVEIGKRIGWAQQNVVRDENGLIVYLSDEEAFKVIIRSMQKLSEQYPRLKGYYGRPKVALCSDILDWMGIGGYTYPYTMEITYNKYVDKFYWYALQAHETAHYKGFYKENEGSFIGFLACLTSDDPLMVYSGCYDAYWDVLNDYYDALQNEYGKDADAKYAEYWLAGIGFDMELAVSDEMHAMKVAQEVYENDDHPLEEYSDTVEEVGDAGWETQDAVIAENDYDDVVRMIAEYYKEKKAEAR